MEPTISTDCNPTARFPFYAWLDCPFCPADWRSQRARWRAQTGSRHRLRQDDTWIRRAIKAQRSALKGRSRDLDLDHAEQLCSANAWVRAELEARILANQPIPDISAIMGIADTVIVAFEALYFDVRCRLQARDWVSIDVLRTNFGEPWEPTDVTAVWRTFGYLYGSATVDLLVNGADRSALESIGLPAYWDDNSRLPKELQMLLITQSLPIRGVKDARSLARFVQLGLADALPHFDRPPKDGTLEMAGNHSWDHVGSWMLAKEPIPAPLSKAV